MHFPFLFSHGSLTISLKQKITGNRYIFLLLKWKKKFKKRTHRNRMVESTSGQFGPSLWFQGPRSLARSWASLFRQPRRSAGPSEMQVSAPHPEQNRNPLLTHHLLPSNAQNCREGKEAFERKTCSSPYERESKLQGER